MQISEDVIGQCAQHAAGWTYDLLRLVHGVPIRVAEEVATDAGNAFAQALSRALRERDVEVIA